MSRGNVRRTGDDPTPSTGQETTWRQFLVTSFVLIGLAALSFWVIRGRLIDDLHAMRLRAAEPSRPIARSDTVAPPDRDLAPPHAGASFRDCSQCPEMVEISAGAFNMGSRDDDAEIEIGNPELGGGDWLTGTDVFVRRMVRSNFDRAKPRHSVVIGHRFALGKFAVTRGEYATFVHETGYATGNDCAAYVHGKYPGFRSFGGSWRRPGFAQSDRDPVVCVSWRDAHAYVAWLNMKNGTPLGDPTAYRIPSEAEWEYATRGGRPTLRWWGDSLGGNNANCAECGSTWDARHTSPVGSFPPNPLGLYDVLGDVAELTGDCWHADYRGAPADGTAWVGGDSGSHVLRGGGWNAAGWALTAAMRSWIEGEARHNDTGFRVAKTLQ